MNKVIWYLLIIDNVDNNNKQTSKLSKFFSFIVGKKGKWNQETLIHFFFFPYTYIVYLIKSISFFFLFKYYANYRIFM